MINSNQNIKFTGEFLVLGQASERIEADHLARYKFATRYAQGKRVLDIACGTGYGAPILLEAGATSYLGVDIGIDQIKYASDNFGSDRARYQVGDICKLASDASYDLVTCFETIEHVPDYKTALANIFKCLCPGGTLIISSPNRPITSPKARTLADKPENEFHTQEFTPTELMKELSATGFHVIENEVYGQRQSWTTRSRWINCRLVQIFGDPKESASPDVELVRRKTPRYFVLVAQKIS